MDRSRKGLEGAGEWPELKKVLPNFKDKRVLDLGCGYGWYCAYAAKEGAVSVLGVDISERMLETAAARTGIMTQKEEFYIFPWTIIIMREKEMPYFWENL